MHSHRVLALRYQGSKNMGRQPCLCTSCNPASAGFFTNAITLHWMYHLDSKFQIIVEVIYLYSQWHSDEMAVRYSRHLPRSLATVSTIYAAFLSMPVVQPSENWIRALAATAQLPAENGPHLGTAYKPLNKTVLPASHLTKEHHAWR